MLHEFHRLCATERSAYGAAIALLSSCAALLVILPTSAERLRVAKLLRAARARRAKAAKLDTATR